MSSHHSFRTARKVFISYALISCALLAPCLSMSAQGVYNDVYFEAVTRDDLYTLKVIALTKGLYKGANTQGRTLLHEAAQRGNEAIVEYLLTQGFALNIQDKQGDTPLLVAIKNKHRGVASKLLAKGAYATLADNESRTPLHVALEDSELFDALIPALIDKGANVNARNKEGITPLMVYASHAPFSYGPKQRAVKLEKKSTALGQLLLSKNARVNAVDNQGQSALHKALARGNNKAAAFLVDAGAQVNLKDKKGMTPLHYVHLADNLPLKIMLAKGAQINARDNQGNTPTHRAADSTFSGEILKLLKENGAAINAVNNAGQTPLHIAAEYKNEWYADDWAKWCEEDASLTVQALLKLGANRNAQDKQGKKPIDLAWSDDVKALLRVKNK